MSLLELVDLTAGYGGRPLLDGVTLRIDSGERVAIVGRNGVGKTTLLNVVAGRLSPDDGLLKIGDGVRIASLPQEVPRDMHGSVRSIVASGLEHLADLLAEYETLSSTAAEDLSRTQLDRLDEVTEQINRQGGWAVDAKVDSILDKMGLAADDEFDALSSGRKRRVLLARALVGEPDLLLLDEPTNHLDIESIAWLEGTLAKLPVALLFVTHDRTFLKSLATRIVEVDRARLLDWECDYETFLKRKEDTLAAEAKADAEFDRKLAEEEKWIRQGIKARRTRNEGRVRRLVKMRQERQERRSQIGTARITFQEAARSGHLVVRGTDLSFSYGDERVVDGVSVTLLKGDRVGLIGPNGCGKSTLLKLLLGTLTPDGGEVKLGAGVQVAYFDQLREQIDLDRTAQENVADGAETVTIGGQSRHVLGYLQDFLFTPERARTLARFLSGGERNRLLLSKLFLKPANLLVLDEPTNDLDLETLELLEERLLEFPGTVLVVSHDREFLNQVVTGTIAYEGDGKFREYDGGYDDWLRVRQHAEKAEQASAAVQQAAAAAKSANSSPKPKKLSYREQQELDRLPERIEELETTLERLYGEMATPEFHQQPVSEQQSVNAEATAAQEALDAAFARWDELESKRDGA